MADSPDPFLNPVMNALAVFESVAITGTVSAAAREAGISQSGLSRHLQNLEAHLGVILFHRVSRKMVLTRDGERLFQAVHAGLESIRSVALELHSHARSNQITISCGHGTALFWLFDRFPDLQRSLPHLDISLTVAPMGLLQANHDTDLVIRAGPAPADEYNNDLLFPEDTFLACSQDFLKEHGLSLQELTPQKVLDMPLLHMDRGEHGVLWFGDWFGHFGLNYEPAPQTLYYNSYAHTMEAAIEGKGIALVSRYMNGGAVKDGRLLEVPNSSIKTETGQFLTCRSHDLMDENVKAVHHWLCREAAHVVASLKAD